MTVGTQGQIAILDRDHARAALVGEQLVGMSVGVLLMSSEDELHSALKSSDHDVQCIVAAFDNSMVRETVYGLLEKTNLRNIMPTIFYDADTGQDYVEALQKGAVYVVRKGEPISIIRSVVISSMNVVEENRQLRDEVRRRSSAIGLIQSGEFQIRTLEEARNLSTMLSLACPSPESVALGLVELIVNGIEHGNLGIKYEEKTVLIEQGRWMEEVVSRLAMPENEKKYVTVLFLKVARKIRFRIIDCGDGFDYSNYLEITPERLLGQHGRGILMAQGGCFDRMEYQGAGNEVVVEVDLPPEQDNS